MIGIVIAGYEDFPKSLIVSAQIALGPQKNIIAVPVTPTRAPEDIEGNRQLIFSAITKVDQGTGVLVLTDAMPENAGMIASSLVNEVTIEIVHGVNLPMLEYILRRREFTDLQTLSDEAQQAGTKGIVITTNGPRS